MFTPEEWSHLNDLLHRACQLPLEERDAFARAEAGSQPHLLDELLRMLAVEADAPQAVRAPLRDIGTRLSAELPDPEPGTRAAWARCIWAIAPMAPTRARSRSS